MLLNRPLENISSIWKHHHWEKIKTACRGLFLISFYGRCTEGRIIILQYLLRDLTLAWPPVFVAVCDNYGTLRTYPNPVNWSIDWLIVRCLTPYRQYSSLITAEAWTKTFHIQLRRVRADTCKMYKCLDKKTPPNVFHFYYAFDSLFKPIKSCNLFSSMVFNNSQNVGFHIC